MGAKTEEKRIGSAVYKVTQLDYRESERAFLRLCKILAPGLGKLGEALGGKITREQLATILDDGVDASALGSAVASVVERFEQSDLDYFRDVFNRTTMVHPDGQKGLVPLDTIADAHFAGALHESFEWLAFCLAVNFRRFFGGVRAAGGPLKAQA